jgi:hypothetical protein
LPKNIGIKVMENMLRNTLGTWKHIENLMRTHGELKWNIMRTHWEPGKNEKKSFPPKLKGKKSKTP